MMRRDISFALVAALMLAEPASAQATTSPAAAAPTSADAARLLSARAMVRQMNLDLVLDQMFVQLAPLFATSVIGAMAQDGATKAAIDAVNSKPNGNERMTAILSQEFMTSVKRQYPALKEQTAVEYAAAFTKGELDAITTFYASGPGAKVLRLMPELQQKISASGQKLGQTAGMEAGQRGFERISREILEIKEKPKT